MAAVAPGTVSIYDDALAAGWQDWSWATVNLANTGPVASGTRSIAVTFPAWGGLYLRRVSASISGMTTLSLSVNGGATAGARLQIMGVQGTAQLTRLSLNAYCTGGVIPQNAWTRCQIPLSAMGPAGTVFDGFQIQEADGVARPAMYVDEVALLPAPPAAPVGVTATASASAVALGWSAVSGATGYDVLRATQSGGPFTRVTATPLTGTTWTDTTVAQGATYWYQVTATGPGGTGSASAAVSASVPVPTQTAATIYDDALVAGWQDWSWATVNLANTGPVASGTRSIAVTFPAWGGLYLRRVSASISGMTTLSLSVNGGATAGARLQIMGVQGTAQLTRLSLNAYCTGGVIPQNAWTRCQIPLSAMGPAGTVFDGFQIQEADGVARPAMYVDEVALLTAPPPAAVTVTLSPASGAADACGGKVAFKASVTGSSNTAVTWSVQEGAAGGSVDASGNYTAPAAAGTYHVVATSAASTAATATATVTVTERVLSVTVSPSTLTLAPGATGQFTATVTTTCGSTASAQTVTAPL